MANLLTGNSATADTSAAPWANNPNICTIDHETSIVRTGAGSVRMTTTASGDPYSNHAGVAIDGSTAYEFRVWCRGTAARTGRLYLEWYGPGGFIISTSGTGSIPNGSFGEIVFPYTAPGDADNVTPYIAVDDVAASGEIFYWDDFYLGPPLEEPPPDPGDVLPRRKMPRGLHRGWMRGNA